MTKKIPITVINLKKDIDRKNNITQQLNKLNLKFDFFEAIYGSELSSEELDLVYNPKLSIDNGTRALTRGEVGATLSHFGVYQKMIEDDIDEMIIFEDDIAVGQDFLAALDVIEHLPKNWEVFLLSYSLRTKQDSRLCHFNVNLENNPTSFGVGVPLKVLGGAFCYVINRRGAQRMLSYKDSMHRVIDYYTSDRRMINVYTIYPRVADVNFNLNLDSSVGHRDQLTVSSKWKQQKVVKSIRDFNNARRKKREDKGRFSINCMLKKIKFKIKYTFKKYYK
jgi:glycosyl transferase, family 25